MWTTLISAADLATELRARPGSLVVLDCRHRLDDPAEGARLYRAGHVPGAFHAALEWQLAAHPALTSEGHTGRHPLPDEAAWLDQLGAWGVTPRTQVVAYDDAAGAFAARLWWLARAAGHVASAVLDGGLPAWLAAGGTLETGPASPAPAGRYPGRLDGSRFVSLTDVKADALGARPELLLLDAREPARFNGTSESLDPVAGHIPGARNAFFKDNLAPDGRFKPASELAERFREVAGGAAAESVVSYCGSGVTACHNLLALEHAGLAGARLFVGSWSAWCRTPGLPIARG